MYANVQSGSTSAAENAIAGTAAVAAFWNNVPLRPATVAELEALDSAWDSTTGTPGWWTEDLGPGSIRLYPGPGASGTLAVVNHGAAPRLSVENGTTTTLYEPLSEWLWYATLATTRGQTGETTMPDVAAAADDFAGKLRAIAIGYWGAAL